MRLPPPQPSPASGGGRKCLKPRHVIHRTNQPESVSLTLTNRGGITIQGNRAAGILGQTFNDGSPLDIDNWAPITTQRNESTGIIAFASSTGSPITFNNRGAITTQGDLSEGIVAQSVRGGSPINLDNWAPITTQGSSSPGIFAFSQGIGGASAITITNRANVIANGLNADSIRMQSDNASSTVTVNLFGGLVQGGTGAGDGVNLTQVVGTSTVNVFAGATVTTLGDKAIEGFGGNETVNNWGIVLKYLFGDALLAAAVSGGHGWYDTTRNFDYGGFAARADASHGISHLTGRLRGAYAFTNGRQYVKPLVDLNVSWIGIDGFTESGGGGAALIVNRTDETVLSASPAVEFGWQHRAEDGTLVRPYVRAGVTVLDDPELALVSSFAAAPAPGFRTVMDTDDAVGEITVGLDVLTASGTVIKAFYEGQFGEHTKQQLAGIRASWPF